MSAPARHRGHARARPRPGARPPARTRRVVACVSVLLAVLVAGCESNGVEGGLDFERMVVQPKSDAYEGSGLFADGRAMRSPPEHVVRNDQPADAVLRTGRRNAVWVEHSPVPFTTAVLERGRDRFGVYCAPCHGFGGTAGTPIGQAMRLQPPPSLHEPRIRALSDGYLFGVVSGGYGLMPSYANQLPARDRWAVVGYVRALQLSRRVVLDSLAPAQRASIVDELAGGNP